jgi:hypothetical protein
MSRPVSRIYATCGACLALGLAWAGIASQGMGNSAPAPDPQIEALAVREAKIEAKAKRAKAIVDRRWAVYRAELKRRKVAAARVAAAPPVVRYVTLPPITVSRSS